LRERDRLLSVIGEAKTARHKLRQINVLITMYGDDEKVSLVALNGDHSGELVVCEDCGREFKGSRGLETHQRLMHGSVTAAARKKSATRAAKARGRAR